MLQEEYIYCIKHTIDLISSNLDIQMEKPNELICDFSERNNECTKEKRPYYNKES